jgi:hypothetical protein
MLSAGAFLPGKSLFVDLESEEYDADTTQK